MGGALPSYERSFSGAISSVVERLLHTQEVAGSNPASRTISVSGGRRWRRRRCRGGNGRGRRRWASRLESSSVGYEKRRSGHGRHCYLSWAGNHYLLHELRWNRWLLVDERSHQHIVRLTISCHRHHTALTADFLRKIPDGQELPVDHIECQRFTRRRDHDTLEITSDNGRCNRAKQDDDEFYRLPLHPDLILRLAPMGPRALLLVALFSVSDETVRRVRGTRHGNRCRASYNHITNHFQRDRRGRGT